MLSQGSRLHVLRWYPNDSIIRSIIVVMTFFIQRNVCKRKPLLFGEFHLPIYLTLYFISSAGIIKVMLGVWRGLWLCIHLIKEKHIQNSSELFYFFKNTAHSFCLKIYLAHWVWLMKGTMGLLLAQSTITWFRVNRLRERQGWLNLVSPTHLKILKTDKFLIFICQFKTRRKDKTCLHFQTLFSSCWVV